MRVLTVLFLVAALFAGCRHVDAPPPGFVMHCDVCGQTTRWKDAYPYFECTISGTRW